MTTKKYNKHSYFYYKAINYYCRKRCSRPATSAAASSGTTNLLIQEDLVSLEVVPEAPHLGADVLLHHSEERHLQLLQLRLQRGELGSLLQERQQGASVVAHHCCFNAATSVNIVLLCVFVCLALASHL